MKTPRDIAAGPQRSNAAAAGGAVDKEYVLARAWEQRGKLERAITGYARCLQAQPDHLDACQRLVGLLRLNERNGEACRWAELTLAHHPDSAELHKAMIATLTAAGGHDSAFDHYGLRRCDERSLDIEPGEVLCCLVERNEAARLPHLLDYYRRLRVDRFFAVDNGSTDGSLAYLLDQPDVHVWQAEASFRSANFGSAWFELLLSRYGDGHWCLTLDADELLVFPGCEERSLHALCAELQGQGKSVLGAVLVDMYGEGAVQDTRYTPGRPFLEACPYFDRRYYHERYEQGGPYRNQTVLFGGVRHRVFGAQTQVYLNKIPLLRYAPDCILAGGQHWTNRPAEAIAEQGAALLHFKFFDSFAPYVSEQVARGEHYDDAYQYRHYAEKLGPGEPLVLYDPQHSVRYVDSMQLVRMGIVKALGTSGGRRPAHAPPVAPVEVSEPRPFWSVMITVYDRTHLLGQALHSVVQQAEPPEDMEDDIEIVVVHDGGAPEAVYPEVAGIVSDVGMGRARHLRCPHNLGHPGIFNECIRQARGRWVHVLHDDDWVEPGFYAALRAGVQGSPAGMAFCRFVLQPAQGERWLSWLEREQAGILDDWLGRIATLCRQQFAATVVRRDVFEELGGFTAAAGSAFDWEMWQRIAAFHPVWYEPRPLAVGRSDGTALTDGLTRSGRNIADSLSVIDLAQAYLPAERAADLRRNARRRYAEHALWVAGQAIDRGDYRTALVNLRAGLLAHRDETTWQRVLRVLDAADPETTDPERNDE